MNPWEEILRRITKMVTALPGSLRPEWAKRLEKELGGPMVKAMGYGCSELYVIGDNQITILDESHLGWGCNSHYETIIILPAGEEAQNYLIHLADLLKEKIRGVNVYKADGFIKILMRERRHPYLENVALCTCEVVWPKDQSETTEREHTVCA